VAVISNGLVRDLAGIRVCLVNGTQYCSKNSGSQRSQQIMQSFGAQRVQPDGVVESQRRWSLSAD
jgi:hypothetical protein